MPPRGRPTTGYAVCDSTYSRNYSTLHYYANMLKKKNSVERKIGVLLEQIHRVHLIRYLAVDYQLNVLRIQNRFKNHLRVKRHFESVFLSKMSWALNQVILREASFMKISLAFEATPRLQLWTEPKLKRLFSILFNRELLRYLSQEVDAILLPAAKKRLGQIAVTPVAALGLGLAGKHTESVNHTIRMTSVPKEGPLPISTPFQGNLGVSPAKKMGTSPNLALDQRLRYLLEINITPKSSKHSENNKSHASLKNHTPAELLNDIATREELRTMLKYSAKPILSLVYDKCTLVSIISFKRSLDIVNGRPENGILAKAKLLKQNPSLLDTILSHLDQYYLKRAAPASETHATLAKQTNGKLSSKSKEEPKPTNKEKGAKVKGAPTNVNLAQLVKEQEEDKRKQLEEETKHLKAIIDEEEPGLQNVRKVLKNIKFAKKFNMEMSDSDYIYLVLAFFQSHHLEHNH